MRELSCWGLALIAIFTLVSCEDQISVPPVSIGGLRNAVYVGDGIELSAELNPIDGAEYMYEWAVTEGAMTANAKFTPESAGRIEVRVRVADKKDLTSYSEAKAAFKSVNKMSGDNNDLDIEDLLPESADTSHGTDGEVEWRIVEDGLAADYIVWLSDNVSISGSHISLKSGVNPSDDCFFEVQAYREDELVDGMRVRIALKHIHSFGVWTVTDAATCEQNGTERRDCTICGRFETRNTQALGHDWSGSWTSDGQEHWHACSRCSKHNDETSHSLSLKGNKNGHLQECSVCGWKSAVTDHDASSVICATCGYDSGYFKHMKVIPAVKDLKIQEKTISLSAFEISEHELTQDVWKWVWDWVAADETRQAKYLNVYAGGKSNPSDFNSEPSEGEEQGSRPVEKVSWLTAVEFCNAISVMHGLNEFYAISGTDVTVSDWKSMGFRLPTESEWEYAASGGVYSTEGNPLSGAKYSYAGSDTITDVAWFWDFDTADMTHQVGLKSANDFSLYDMTGNVWEWCWDWSESDYNGSGLDYHGPETPGTPPLRIYRGGAWNTAETASYISARSSQEISYTSDVVGFRLARSAEE